MRRRELLTGMLGSLLLAWTAMVVGHLVGPPDPHEVADQLLGPGLGECGERHPRIEEPLQQIVVGHVGGGYGWSRTVAMPSTSAARLGETTSGVGVTGRSSGPVTPVRTSANR